MMTNSKRDFIFSNRHPGNLCPFIGGTFFAPEFQWRNFLIYNKRTSEEVLIFILVYLTIISFRKISLFSARYHCFSQIIKPNLTFCGKVMIFRLKYQFAFDISFESIDIPAGTPEQYQPSHFLWRVVLFLSIPGLKNSFLETIPSNCNVSATS